MGDAKLARDKAKIEADAKLSDEAKGKKITELQRAREDERINQTASTMDKRASIDEKAATATGKVLQKAKDDLSAAVNARSAVEELKKTEELLRTELETTLGFGKGDEVRERLELVQAFRKSAEAKLPEKEAKIPALEKALEEARAAFSKEAKTADSSRAAAEAFKQEQANLKPVTNETRDAEDKKARGQSDAEKAAFEKEKARIAKIPKEVLDTQVATGLYSDEAAYSAVRGAKNWSKYHKKEEPEAAKPPTTPAGQGAVRDPLAPAVLDPQRIHFGDAPFAPSEVGAKNQITRGQLKPGSDNTANSGKNSLTPLVESVEAAASPMEATSAALQEAAGVTLPDFTPAATAADALAKTISDFAATNGGFASTTVASLSATAGVVTNHDGQIRTLEQTVRIIQGQMAAMRTRK